MGKLVILINKFLSKLNILKKRVDYIGGNDVLPPPLKKEEEEDLQNFIENHIKEGNNYQTWNVSREFDNLLEK